MYESYLIIVNESEIRKQMSHNDGCMYSNVSLEQGDQVIIREKK